MIDNIKCCVIDDEPLAAHLIASYVEKTPYLTLSRIFHNASEAVQELLDSDIELIFLDIPPFGSKPLLVSLCLCLVSVSMICPLMRVGC